jgi:hypothetical protein
VSFVVRRLPFDPEGCLLLVVEKESIKCEDVDKNRSVSKRKRGEIRKVDVDKSHTENEFSL